MLEKLAKIGSRGVFGRSYQSALSKMCHCCTIMFIVHKYLKDKFCDIFLASFNWKSLNSNRFHTLSAEFAVFTKRHFNNKHLKLDQMEQRSRLKIKE